MWLCATSPPPFVVAQLPRLADTQKRKPQSWQLQTSPVLYILFAFFWAPPIFTDFTNSQNFKVKFNYIW
jgi:hypothetical protein